MPSSVRTHRGSHSPSPIFVLGCDRSGTTLLQSLLNAHPEVFIAYETGVPVRLHGRYGRLNSDAQREALVAEILGDLAFRDVASEVRKAWNIRPGSSFGELVDGAFRARAAAAGKTIWGDKLPRYSLHVPFLADLFPGSWFLHIHRDPRDTCRSLASMSWGPGSVFHAASMWERYVGEALSGCRQVGRDRARSLAFEDLVRDPETVMREVCGFLGLEFDRRMLDDDVRQEGMAPSVRAAPDHATLAKPVRAESVTERSALSKRDLETVERVCGRWMDELGYERRVAGWGDGVGFVTRVRYGVHKIWHRLRSRR